MMRRIRKRLTVSMLLLSAFVLWTAAVLTVDVQAIGPLDTSVGFAGINRLVHDVTGVHMALYRITDWLSLIPAGICAGFGMLGLKQWIGRRSLLNVDRSILALGGFYIVVLAAYALFETLAVNYRPVLIEGALEASYPSSTTMLVLCVMPTALMQIGERTKSRVLRRCASVLIPGFTAFMVVGRLVSGVHWLTDIVGGALLSGGLVMLYVAFSDSE